MKIQFIIDDNVVNEVDYNGITMCSDSDKIRLTSGITNTPIWSFTEDQYKAALDGRLVIGGTEIKLV